MDDNSVLPPAIGSDVPVNGVSIPDVAAQTATTPVPGIEAQIAPSLPAATPAVPSTPLAPNPAKLSSESPEIAEDVDLIEKEWVAKAKAIVSRTAQDPNLQTTELGKFKADYLKTRFNKEVKTGK